MHNSCIPFFILFFIRIRQTISFKIPSIIRSFICFIDVYHDQIKRLNTSEETEIAFDRSNLQTRDISNDRPPLTNKNAPDDIKPPLNYCVIHGSVTERPHFSLLLRCGQIMLGENPLVLEPYIILSNSDRRPVGFVDNRVCNVCFELNEEKVNAESSSLFCRTNMEQQIRPQLISQPKSTINSHQHRSTLSSNQSSSRNQERPSLKKATVIKLRKKIHEDQQRGRLNWQRRQRQQHNVAMRVAEPSENEIEDHKSKENSQTLNKSCNTCHETLASETFSSKKSSLPASPAIRRQRGERLSVGSLKKPKIHRLPFAASEDTEFSRRLEKLLSSGLTDQELWEKATASSSNARVVRSPPQQKRLLLLG